MEPTKVKIEVYLPLEVLEPLSLALGAAGIGQVGSYDHVTAYAPSAGTWRPLPGSRPYAGETGARCHGEEYKLELRCLYTQVGTAVEIIRRLHPYEEPLINILPLLNDRFGVE